ncbi:hypothetical protein B0H12DRAFT_1145024 [Mycena haematopus]|nr:hypothetical protein B0H12DRAFT_1145024 [Mycena haematopus]
MPPPFFQAPLPVSFFLFIFFRPAFPGGMLYIAALVILYRTASFTRVGAARLRSIRVDTYVPLFSVPCSVSSHMKILCRVHFADALDIRQTFDVDPNVDPNINNDDGLTFDDGSTSTIWGLSTVKFATTLTGLALVVLVTLIWLCYRERKKRRRVPDPEFYAPAFTGPVTQLRPPPIPARPERSFSILKREQTAAIPHYEDTHTEPDVLLRTADGLQLLPGSSPPKKKGYMPFWRVSNGSSK